jgi:hypothetical protein
MALAACRMGDAGKAKGAWAQLPLASRQGVRNECKAKGIKLGL